MNANKDTNIAQISQGCNLLPLFLKTDEMMFLDAWENLPSFETIDIPWLINNEFGNFLNFAKLSHLSSLTRSQWSAIRSSLGKHWWFSHHFLAVENDSLEEYCKSSLSYDHMMYGASGSKTPISSHVTPNEQLKTTFVGIMDGSRKRAACHANAKSSPDEDFGNDFLSSWKVPKSGEDTIDFDVESVLKSNKNFIFDNLGDFGLGVSDLDFSSPLKKNSKHRSSNGSDLSEGKKETENDNFFSFDFNKEHKHAQTENTYAKPYRKPGLLGLSTDSLNAKRGHELLSAGNSSILNAQSSTGHSVEETNATCQVVIEFLNICFEFLADKNCMIGSVVLRALCGKGITGVDDCYFSCQLDIYSGHEVFRNTSIKEGSIIHVHLRTRGGNKKRKRGESKKLKAYHVALDLYINLLKSKRQPTWFEKVDLPYDVWWEGFASDVLLGADSSNALALVLDSLERVHQTGYCYNGSFPVQHIYYNSKLKVVEIISSDATLSRITRLGLFNDYSIIVQLINTYFSYVRSDVRLYPMYVEALLLEIAKIPTKPRLCYNPIRRAALSKPLCTMSSTDRLNIYTSVIIYAKTNSTLASWLRRIESLWLLDFKNAALSRIPEEFLARYSYSQSDGTTKKKQKLYVENLYSHTDYARCFISHSALPGKVLDAALYRKWKRLLVNLHAEIVQVLTDGKPPSEKVPDVPTESANQVENFASMCTANEVDLREVIRLV